MKLSRSIVLVAVFILALLLLGSAVNTSTAQISPLSAPQATLSPLPTPTAQPQDPYYVEVPMVVTPHPVPYVNRYGETIIKEEVFTSTHHQPAILQYKATPSASASSRTVSPLTQSQNDLTLDHYVYLPLVAKNTSNASVLAIVYQWHPPRYDPVGIINKLIGWIAVGTTWHGSTLSPSSISFAVVDGAPHFIYNRPPYLSNGYLDLNAIYAQNNICARIQAGEVDEVWIFVDGEPDRSPTEFTINGVGWNFYLGDMTTPYCGRQIYNLIFNYDTIVGNALESWTHSAEASWMLYASSGYEACDVQTASVAPEEWGWRQSQCTGSYAYSDQYAFMTRPGSMNSDIGVCGWAHEPPNRLFTETVRYIWNDPTSRSSRCTDWQWGDSTTYTGVSCSDWSCTSVETPSYPGQIEFFIWYLQKAPGLNNDSHGRSGQLRSNWWSFRMPLP